MRAALCISGQPRDIELGVEQIRNRVLNVNDGVSIDVFCHCWDPKEIWDSSQQNLIGTLSLPNKKYKELISDILKPKTFVSEMQKDFSYADLFIGHPTAKQRSIASSFYSVYLANRLKSIYEYSKSITYDYVIRARYDLSYDTDIVLNQYSKVVSSKIVVPCNYQLDQDAIPWNSVNKGMVDVFAISSSKNMDVYSSTYLHLKDINSKYYPPFAEVYLGVNTRVFNGIELHYADIKLDLLRRKYNG